jgi:hypothetical protein
MMPLAHDIVVTWDLRSASKQRNRYFPDHEVCNDEVEALIIQRLQERSAIGADDLEPRVGGKLKKSSRRL